MDSKKRSIRFDEFIKAVRPDPKSTTPLVMLTGYIGESSEEGHIRMYEGSNLARFFEIPESAILHAEPNTKEEDPLGGSKIWVKADTVFIYGDPNQELRPKGSFLQGSLYDSYVQYPGGPNIIVGPETRSPLYCHSQNLGCSIGLPCQSEYMTACVSSLIACPSRGPYTQCICPEPCTKPETRCVYVPTQWPKNCTAPPDCPNGRTCVKTCNGSLCLGETSPETCNPNPTIPGGPYCRTPGGYTGPGYGFGTFNPYR